MATRIHITNEKGGVAKSTTVVNVAAVLAQQGKRTLVCDLDQQATTSMVLLPNHEELTHAMHDVFAGNDLSAHDLVHATAYDNLFIMPADQRLALYEKTHGFETDPASMLLADTISEVDAQYDYIIIDSPPRSYLTTYAGLLVTDLVVCPLIPETPSIHSCQTFQEALVKIQHTQNPGLQVRYFLSMYRSDWETHVGVLKSIRAGQTVIDPALLLDTIVKPSAMIAKAMSIGAPVTHFSPNSIAAANTRELVNEILSTLKQPTHEQNIRAA